MPSYSRPSAPACRLPRTIQEQERSELALRAIQCRKRFSEFVADFWNVAEPAAPYIETWHVGAVCEHLEAVARGQIRRLVINIPPGHAKSLLASVLFPAWVWTWAPEWRALFASYAQSLAVRDSVRCRTVIESERYRSMFAGEPLTGKELWRLKDDQNAKDFYENTRSGFRMALGVGGKGTGYRGNLVLVDDALNVSDATSKAIRETTRDWWFQTMSSRVNDLSRDSFVVMGQRVHEEDLAGECIARGYEVLRLPSEFQKSMVRETSLGQPDKRTVEGELLFPRLFSKDVLQQAKTDLGSDGYAGQHDQNPTPPGGGTFKREWWRFWRRADIPPSTTPRPKGCTDQPTRLINPGQQWDWIRMSVDATFKDAAHSKSGNVDWVVITVWAGLQADRFLLWRWREQAGLKRTCDGIREAMDAFPRIRQVLVEDKANGPAVIEALEHEIAGIKPISPAGGKEARAAACAPQIESGNVYLPEGEPWLEEWIGEFANFPRGRHDDQVDSCTQLLVECSTARAGSRTHMLVSGAFSR
jgi:predicted phage terminase large subunit-like protein